MDFLVRLAVYALLEKEPCTPSGLEKALTDLGLEVNSMDLSHYIQRQHLEVKALTLVTGDGGRAYGLSSVGQQMYLELKAEWSGIQGKLEALLSESDMP